MRTLSPRRDRPRQGGINIIWRLQRSIGHHLAHNIRNPQRSGQYRCVNEVSEVSCHLSLLDWMPKFAVCDLIGRYRRSGRGKIDRARNLLFITRQASRQSPSSLYLTRQSRLKREKRHIVRFRLVEPSGADVTAALTNVRSLREGRADILGLRSAYDPAARHASSSKPW
jgi:hypothetical protein